MGDVHMPEAELRAFLRVFLPEERVEPALDSIALMGLEIEATDPLELFVLAHMEVEPDPRVTLESEAVVLVEEVGLDAVDVSAILGIEETAVIDAVDRAWADHDGADHDGADHDDPDPEPDPDPDPESGSESDPESAPEADPESESLDAGPLDRTVELPGVPLEAPEPPAPAPDEDRAAAGPPPVLVAPRRRPWGAIIGTVAAVGAIGGLGLVATSDAGQQILAMQGIDPFVFVAVIVGLVFGGMAFVRAGSSPPPLDQPKGHDTGTEGPDIDAATDEEPDAGTAGETDDVTATPTVSPTK